MSQEKKLARRAEYFSANPPFHHPGEERKSSSPRAKIGTLVQVRTLDGDIVDRSPNLEDSMTLPLSEVCLQAMHRGEPWVEIGSLETERLLIHNQPFASTEDESPLVLQVAMSLADQDQNLNTLGRILTTGSSIAVIAAFGIGWLLAGLTLRPINRLRLTAQAIGAERDFNRRVTHTGPNDEIGQLVTTFNDMLAALQTAYLQVEETLQAQRRFVADASHELRTPLTTLRGNIGLLQRQPPINAEDQADVLADMVEETERLMRLVSELLTLARADAGRPLPKEPVSLKPILEDVYQQVKLLAPRRAIIYRPAAEATVIGNGDALKQTLLVLLDNALKYTPPEATITLTTVLDDGQVAIQVSDDGPGIESKHLPHIFDRFYRADAARSSAGTGLGLAIARPKTASLPLRARWGRAAGLRCRFPGRPLKIVPRCFIVS